MNGMLKEINKLTKIKVGSEDDLILKVVIPFFSFLGYKNEQFELKYPISCYRPNKAGRKPEADCVYFSNSNHNVNTSLLVIEVKREDQPPPEEQARFYSANLFVPFYITWEGFEFQIFQLHNFQEPSNLGKYTLCDLTAANFYDLKAILSPVAISSFCETNEIKSLDLDDIRRKIEAIYVDNLQKDLRYFKMLDSARRLDILQVYVTPYIRDLTSRAVPMEKMENEIREGVHPSALESQLRETRQSFPIEQALNSSSTIAIIGDPGAGKTTLLKHFCIQHCFSESSKLPIFIAIRELVAKEETLLEAIYRNISRHGSTDNPETIYENALIGGRLLLCVDGLDEMDIQDPAHARRTLRKLAAELADIGGRNHKNVVVISARRESWPTCRPEIPSNFQEYEIIPFSPSDIRAFVSKWFEIEEANLSKSLIDEFRIRGWPEFASNPLLLALTCIVYEKRGRLPDRLSTLYQRCIDVLLEEWDATRRISRRGGVHGLTPERKLDVIAEMALSFHTKRRACFSHEEVLKELILHLPKVGLVTSEAGNVFDEISAQHGLIRSWSIEDYYAFPHLVFQEYLAAKALKDRPEGFKELIMHKDDPFWHSTILIYAGIGDASELVNELLQSEDNILNSSLFLAAECLGTGPKLIEIDLRHQVIERLKVLTNSKITFLKNRAIDALSSIDTLEASDTLKSLIRDKRGRINAGSYVARYIIKIEGEAVAEEIVEEIIKNNDYVSSDLIESLHWLPQQKAISLLKKVVESQDYPLDNDPKKDLGTRHRRNDAVTLLAKIGEEESIPILLDLLSLNHLEDYVKARIVQALASIKYPRIPLLLRDIIQSDDYPVDCKVEAAHHLGANDPDAKKYLLSLVADHNVNFYDRRDAASALCDFKLCDNDIPLLEKLLNDLDPGFWGGPAFAAEAISNIGSKASLSSLRKAYSIWKRSDYLEKAQIIYRIRELLLFADREFDVEKVFNNLLRSTYRHDAFYLPDLAVKYYHLKPDKANEMFLKTIAKKKPKGYWAVIQILPKIPLTKSLIDATVDLAKRTPNGEYIWSILDRLWKRRDLEADVRRAFFKHIQ